MLSADDWVCNFVLFVVQMRHPAQGATGGWVTLGLVFKLFPMYEFSLFDICQGQFGEGNGTPLQYSCLENPMGGGAWQAAVHGVTQSRTQLK